MLDGYKVKQSGDEYKNVISEGLEDCQVITWRWCWQTLVASFKEHPRNYLYIKLQINFP